MSILENTFALMLADVRFKDLPFAENIVEWCGINDVAPFLPLLEFSEKDKDIVKALKLSLAERAKLDKAKLEIIKPEINESEEIVDSRFEKILMRGVRKFPSWEQQIEDDRNGNPLFWPVFYGIDFAGDSAVKSKVVLGSNGVGKSSVYASLEKVSLGHLYSADSRGYVSDKEQRDYLRHIGATANESLILLHTCSRRYQYNLDGDATAIIPYPSCFCMEYDIEILSKKLDNSYIASQLGILDYFNLIRLLQDLKKSYENRKDIYSKTERIIEEDKLRIDVYQKMGILSKEEKALMLEICDRYSDIIKINERHTERKIDTIVADARTLWKVFFPEKPITELISIFEDSSNLSKLSTSKTAAAPDTELPLVLAEKGLDFLYSSIKNYYGKTSITELINRIDVNTSVLEAIQSEAPLCGISENEYSNFIRIYNYLLENYQKTLKSVVEKGKIVFPILMEDYFKSDMSNIGLSLKDINISVDVIACDPATRRSFGPVDPRKYLNTFRFKLYCVSLKISLAFACAQLYRVNAPIVIDDVFDSSDFSNREKIKEFIIHIFEAHKKIFNESQKLQLIFFTQDDVIADSVYWGIADHEGMNEVEYSRLYDYTEAEPSDESIVALQLSDSGDKENIISVRIDQRIR